MTSMPAFFFQAEDGIRATSVTGVQTCALPIWHVCPKCLAAGLDKEAPMPELLTRRVSWGRLSRSEERRVGKECRSQMPLRLQEKIVDRKIRELHVAQQTDVRPSELEYGDGIGS